MSAPRRTLFVGKHQRNLDSKNRLTIPSKWRFDGDMEDDAFLALPDPSGCITVLPPSQVDKFYSEVENIRLSDVPGQTLLDKLLSQTVTFGCDKQGRINLPEELLAHSGIDKEAVIIGRMTTFRLFAPERWAKQDPKLNNDDIGALMRQAHL